MSSGLITLGFIVVSLALTAGLLVKIYLDRSDSSAQITWKEYIIGSFIGIPIVVLIVGSIGWKMAWNNVVTYHEYWNGWELQAAELITPCTRDGSCIHEYSCDPYLVPETYSCNCDKDGCDTCTRMVTRYHSCPYATHEYTYLVQTTLGDYTIDSHVFSSSPLEWRGGSGVPGHIQRGPSRFWLDAKARCEAGQPGPVTKKMDYENYILASDNTILTQYSDQIRFFTDAGLLPPLRTDIKDWYLADKVYFVGLNPSNASVWQNTHALLNSAFGSELQGDLHLVIVQNPLADSHPDAYITALKAYWQNSETWQKDALSKNSLIIVLGTDGQTVTWARAETGMPLGNESLKAGVQTFFRENDVPLTPEAVIGSVSGQFYEKVDTDTGERKIKVQGIGESGALRRLLWGMDNPATKFTRISMKGGEEDDVGSGFSYLSSEIQPTTGQKWLIGTITFILCLVVWFAFAMIGESKGGYRWRHSTYS